MRRSPAHRRPGRLLQYVSVALLGGMLQAAAAHAVDCPLKDAGESDGALRPVRAAPAASPRSAGAQSGEVVDARPEEGDSCRVDATVARAQVGSILVDMRGPQYSDVHPLEGALQMRRSELSPARVRELSAPLLLIGSGLDDSVLDALCLRLRAEASPQFSLQVVRGGARAWRAGDTSEIQPAVNEKLSPPQLFSLLQDSTVVLLVGPGVAGQIDINPARVVRLPAGGPDARLVDRLRAQASDALVLWTTEPEPAWQARLAQPGMPLLWIFEDGHDQYARWRANQSAQVATRAAVSSQGCRWN